MRKLILKCGLAPGDLVMLTAAVRDLHHWNPGSFLTDVRTFCPELWEHNPHITPLSEDDPDVEQIDCSYPLINQCNKLPFHCLHGFIDYLNQRLDLKISLTAFKGDIHLSEREKSWYSQVQELTGQDTPFWIVAAGGKYDVTVKWWEHKRYQEVVDHFRGRLQFVQVGSHGHHHPKLEGVIDLRGQTTFRELIRLVYHADGVLCPITALMHLAAAVESKRPRRASRPCVVIAGGREPAHWESYPGHQFLHVIGALHCCRDGGCWKDRAVPLRDGDKRDRHGSLCLKLVGSVPHCMHIITAEEVIRRIEHYYAGGVLRPLTPRQHKAAERGIGATAKNDYEAQPLNIHNAGLACDQFVSNVPRYPGHFEGRGIVICGGGVRYFTNAWVCIQMLRRLGCKQPIELWHLGRRELDERMRTLVAPFGVDCVDAFKLHRKHPVRLLHGWALKPYAMVHSRFREILFLDADNVPVVNPEFLFETPQFQDLGALFWPDYGEGVNKRATPVWRSCGLQRPREREFESGQIVVDKERCWQALCLSSWFNENADFFYHYLHGDKETFHLAFRKLRQPYALVPTPIHALEATMCQHDFNGRRIFQHRNADKWDYLMCNRKVKDFWFEAECRDYLVRLRDLWDGRVSSIQNGAATRPASSVRPPKVKAVMISCAARNEMRRQTLANLAKTDWADLPLHIQMDEGSGDDFRKRQTRCAFLALHSAVGTADYILFLEDDLDFNRHLRHNLFRWRPLRERTLTLASLYNPGLTEFACDRSTHSRFISPNSVFGSQALLISNDALSHILAHWNRVPGLQDIKISRLAGRLGSPVRYHAPSLIQHTGRTSVSEARFHQARDFDPDWRTV